MDNSDRQQAQAGPLGAENSQDLDEELLSDWFVQQQRGQTGFMEDEDAGEDVEADDPDYEEESDEEEEEDLPGDTSDVELEVFLGGEDDEDDDGDEDELTQGVLAGAGVGWLSRAQLLALISNRNVGELLDDDDEDDDYIGMRGLRRRRRRSPLDPDRFPKVPSERGTELMHSGMFGANDFRVNKKKELAGRILDRELGIYDRSHRQRNQDLMAQGMIPSSKAEMIIHYDEPVYSGQFSDDGNFFYACGHDFKVRMYDTSNPYDWRYYKTVHYPFGQWTLTDASLSPDNRWLAYTSIQTNVCLAPTDPNDTGDPYTLNLADRGSGRRGGWRSWDSFGIWSVRFSGDGRELVAGTNSHSIIVYDIESRTVLHSVEGHDDDVNAVCFADKSSPHILYSGSDDTTIKVWDRRSMGDRRAAGAFVGHVEGLTYIDSKGDGRYILSNGKDQTMKLWDLRMVMSTDRFRELNPTQHTGNHDFDYRWGFYRDEDWFPHPDDNSVVTYRGHKVLRTLIRCHFSPPSSTNSRYVYTGSQDGKVWIYNMDATVAGVIDVNAATLNSRPQERRQRFYHGENFPAWRTCVRDASWHPEAPVLVASAWNGLNASMGTCTLHSYNETKEDEAEPRMGRSVDEELKRYPSLFNDVV